MEKTAFMVIAAISVCHLLNDVMQAVFTALYPILKAEYRLDFTQIGLLTLVFQIAASLLQPVVGLYTDRRPMPYSLPFGMAVTFAGLLMLAFAHSYSLLVVASCLIGIGSSVFHPEASRVARLASGGRHGLSQSLFQVGGNAGTAIGPLLVAFIVLPRGQESIAWFALFALLAMGILWRVSGWYSRYRKAAAQRPADAAAVALPRGKVMAALVILGALVFSKNVYLANMFSFYTFYLIAEFGVSVRDSQLFLFLFLGAVAVGTVIGGPVGDRFGRKAVLWVSILGVLPFSLILPFVNLFWVAVISVVIGVVMASAFPAIVVLAQELVPGRIGMVSGLFYGLGFGLGGLGAAVFGAVADRHGIRFVFEICALLPAIGILTAFLPQTPRSGMRIVTGEAAAGGGAGASENKGFAR